MCLGPVNSFVISGFRYKRIIINAFSATGVHCTSKNQINDYFSIPELLTGPSIRRRGLPNDTSTPTELYAVPWEERYRRGVHETPEYTS